MATSKLLERGELAARLQHMVVYPTVPLVGLVNIIIDGDTRCFNPLAVSHFDPSVEMLGLQLQSHFSSAIHVQTKRAPNIFPKDRGIWHKNLYSFL